MARGAGARWPLCGCAARSAAILRAHRVFIDGHYDQVAPKRYFEMIHPFLARHAVLVFDDIRWSVGMRAAWKEIRSDPRVKYAVGLDQWGICLLEKGVVGPKSSYAIPI